MSVNGERVKALPHPKTVSANLGCSRAVPWSMPGRKMMVSLYPSFARPSSVRPLLLLVLSSFERKDRVMTSLAYKNGEEELAPAD